LWRSVTSPVRCARAGGGEANLAAAVGREDEVVAAQGDGFFRAQRRVVQAAEERGQLRLDAGDLGRIGGGCLVECTQTVYFCVDAAVSQIAVGVDLAGACADAGIGGR
jgi:hypothetical protein